MRRLTEKQRTLLEFVREHSGLTTAALQRAAGYAHQGYESFLRDRLSRLQARGLVRGVVRLGPRGWIVSRTWEVSP